MIGSKTVAWAAATAAALGIVLGTAAPAAAGGIIVIGSPSHDNTCTNHGTHTKPAAGTQRAAGPVQGLLAQVPVVNAINHCGGADLPGENNKEANNNEQEANILVNNNNTNRAENNNQMGDEGD
ncbi:hypothetical protein [Streptomyces sp. PA5.6]|uniref:hypothetical protein n=1 Tax=Streptomyces sp. PA5.6 TaxID=3035651 RepID=UPI0039048DF3